jgi:lysozyme
MDLSSLSEAELDQIIAASGVSEADIPSASPAVSGGGLMNLLGQLGSGMVEGTTGLIGTVADLNPFVPSNFLGPTSIWSPEGFQATKLFQSATDAVLPAQQNDVGSRYSRTVGQFVGPTVGLKVLSALVKGAKAIPLVKSLTSPLAITSDVTAGIGAQAAEDFTGNSTVAPVVGAVAGSMTPMAVGSGVDLLRSLLKGPSADELAGSAGEALRSIVGQSGDEIETAIRARPRPLEQLDSLKTTAEVTENAPLSQLEKQLGGELDYSGAYNTRAQTRQAARDDILGAMTTSKGVPDDFGDVLKGTARASKEAAFDDAMQTWELLPRKVKITDDALRLEQSEVKRIFDIKEAGLPPNSQANLLMNQFLNMGDDATVGKLQDIRSDVLKVARDSTKLNYSDERVLRSLEKGLDRAVEKSLTGDAYNTYLLAREKTRTAKELYGQGVGASLTNKQIGMEKAAKQAFPGSKQGAKDLKAIIGDNPDMLEDVKAMILSDIPRTGVEEVLTPAGFKKYINSKRTGLKEVFGETHFAQMETILDDLQGQAMVGVRAGRASAGNSVTQQKQTVAGAIGNIVANKTGVPDSVRMIGKVLGANTQEATERGIKDLLFKAVMEPDFAAELASAPTGQKVKSMMDRLLGYAMRTSGAGLKSGAIAVGTQEGSLDQLGGMLSGSNVDLSGLSEAELDQIIAASGVSAEAPAATPPADTALPTIEAEGFERTSFIPEEMPEMTLTSDSGIDFIKKHEGLRLTTYKDTAGHDTIGYGRTKNIPKTGKITKEEAEQMLIEDIEAHEQEVRNAVKVPLTQEQFDALSSFTFNLGGPALRRSALLKKLNAGDYEGAADEFVKWNKERVKGKLQPNRGLTKRRQAERELFLSGIGKDLITV